MIFNASNKVEVKNILFGDVYLCSGQSNMELPMSRLSDTYSEEIKMPIILKSGNLRCPMNTNLPVKEKIFLPVPGKRLTGQIFWNFLE